MKKRTLLLAAALAALPLAAFAQGYPSKPIRFVVPYPAGGPLDTIARLLDAKIPYDPVRDFAPITRVASTPNVLVVNPSLPVSSVSELVTHMGAEPVGRTPAEFAIFIRAEAEKYAPVIKASGARVD